MHRSRTNPKAALLPRVECRAFGWFGAVTWICALAFLCARPGLWAGEAPLVLEYKVKAGYLFNFARYVEWPAHAFSAPDSPLVIAVEDPNNARVILEQTLAGKAVDGRPVHVVPWAGSGLSPKPHILWTTRAAGRTPEEVRKSLGNAPTLLVGDTRDFAERGGMIAFVEEEGRIRLTLCLEHASRAGLKVSSRLATVARTVKPERLE